MTAIVDRYVTEMTELVLRLVDESDIGFEVHGGDVESWARGIARGLFEAGLCGEYEVIAQVAGEPELTTYSRMLRDMARRVVEYRDDRNVYRRELAALRESIPPSVPEIPPMPYPEGTLVVDRRDDDGPHFALAVTPMWPERGGEWLYGKHYVQFPERGEPSGGGSFYSAASSLRLPSTPDEKLIAADYLAKARVKAAERELGAAKADAAAMAAAAALMEQAASVPSPSLPGGEPT